MGVNAANKGFVSTMNSTTGSHVIYKMYSKYMDALDGKRTPFPFIHEVFDEIQAELHNDGKQLPESTWNDNTRNIIFKKRNINTKQIVKSLSNRSISATKCIKDEIELVYNMNDEMLSNEKDPDLLPDDAFEPQTSTAL